MRQRTRRALQHPPLWVRRIIMFAFAAALLGIGALLERFP